MFTTICAVCLLFFSSSFVVVVVSLVDGRSSFLVVFVFAVF